MNERCLATEDSLEAVTERNPLISKARDYAKEAHKNQKRDSGEPYFNHPEAVARITCEDLRIHEPAMLAASYLHDTVEDTTITIEQIRLDFGEEVANLVDGLTKITKEIKEENGQKISKDERNKLSVKKTAQESYLYPRVGILKAAADRVHNMRTLEFVRKDKQIPKAKETLIYAKLLESLGVWVKMKELEDLAFKFIDPPVYKKFEHIVKTDKRADMLFVENMVSGLQAQIPTDIKADVTYRVNSLYRLMQKMGRVPDIKEVNDLISFRIIVDEDNDNVAADNCYQILRILQENLAASEDPKRFDNSYFKVKANGYSAVQMTINTPYGAVEIAITSKKKEDFNNWGVVSLIRQGQKELSEYSRVLVFTPEGDVKFFPRGATVIDFAYSIDHSFGARAIKATVDGEEKQMTYVLKNGQSIDVKLGSARIAPSKRWREDPSYCLPETLAVINEQLLNQSRFNQIRKGIKIASSVTQRRGIIDLIDLYGFKKHSQNLTNMLFHIGCKGSLDSLYYQIGAGYISPEEFDKQLEAFGISSNKLMLRSILVAGIDKKGMMEIVSAKIGSFNGNIGALNFGRKTINRKIHFNVRIVAEGLNAESGQILKDSLLQSENIKEVVIV